MKYLHTFESFLNESVELPSAYKVDDFVTFIPSAKQCEERCIKREKRWGRVVKVSFTKAKVFYDILDDYYGDIFTMIDSSFIIPEPKLNLEK